MKKQEKQNNSKLKIIPLGGLEQIGMNITAFEYEDSIIVVDCGLAFPEDDMYGVDLVIPDVTYLKENIQFHFLSHSPKTSVKFLFSFAALIFFPPHGLSFWHQPLSCRCKGMAAGFGNKRSSLRFSEKSPHRWVVFFRKTLYFQPRRP